MNRQIRFYRAFNDDAAAAAAKAAADKAAADKAAADAVDAKKFSQKDFDKFAEEHRKGLQTKNQELIAELDAKSKLTSTTIEEKEQLQARIDQLSKEHVSKEQQAATEFDKLKKKYETETKQKDEEAIKWRKQFETTLKENALTLAAAKHKAHSPDQLLKMFAGDVQIKEALDDSGKGTGRYEAKMTVKTVDPKTKLPVELELNVEDAIGKLREDDAFANMFKDTTAGGFDSEGNLRRRGGSGGGTPPTDPAQFREWRKKNP